MSATFEDSVERQEEYAGVSVEITSRIQSALLEITEHIDVSCGADCCDVDGLFRAEEALEETLRIYTEAVGRFRAEFNLGQDSCFERLWRGERKEHMR